MKKNMLQKVYNYLKSSPLEHNRKLLAVMLCTVIILALVPRIAGVILNGNDFYHNDGVEYRNIAEQISKGNGFSVTLLNFSVTIFSGTSSVSVLTDS